MTTKRIVYERPDGGVSIVCPAPRRIAELMASGMTEDEAVAVIQAKDVPADAANVEVMDRTQIPASREFRNAWEKPGAGAPTIGMPKAREIHAQRIAVALTGEIARLKMEERNERLKGKTVQADQHAADAVALVALDVNVLATQVAGAPNPAALSAIWPELVPK